MSIFTPIIKHFIIKEVKKLMKDLIQPILDLIKALVQPQSGTKFLITIAAMAAIYFMHAKGIATTISDVVLAGMVAVYYVADIYHKPKKKENE